FRLLQLQFMGRNERIAQLPHPRLRLLADTRGNAAPSDEELLPAQAFRGMNQALLEEGFERLHAPFVERVAEARPQQVSRQGEEDPFVVRRTPSSLHEWDQDIEEVAIETQVPFPARPQATLELTPYV